MAEIIDKETKEIADKIYKVGFRNGGIAMKSKILKKINRDWKLSTAKTSAGLIVEILKVINKIK